MKLRKLFEDKDGQIVVGQTPNLPLIVWLISTIIAAVFESTTLGNVANLMAFGSIFTWAWLEIFEGACPFRTILGVLVLIAIVYIQL